MHSSVENRFEIKQRSVTCNWAAVFGGCRDRDREIVYLDEPTRLGFRARLLFGEVGPTGHAE